VVKLRVAGAQINPVVGDLEGNIRLIAAAIARAGAAGAHLLAGPELAVTGYPPEDLVLRPSFAADSRAALKSLLPLVDESLVAVVGFVEPGADGGKPRNAAAVVHDGKLIAVHEKICLPNYGVFDEQRHFAPGDHLTLVEVGGALVAVTICEDLWVEDGPAVAAGRAGADLVVNINASPYDRHNAVVRRDLVARRSRETGCAILYVNIVGGQDELVLDGQSLLHDAGGELRHRSPPFVEDFFVGDLELAGDRPALEPGLPVARVAGPRDLVPAPRDPARPDDPGASPIARLSHIGFRVAPIPDPVEEVYEALVLGTRDYATKNGFHSVVLGLSGGIDSSLTAVIAVDALGPNAVHGVAMPSPYSSPESLEDAVALTEALGIDLMVVPISEVFEAFLASLAPGFEGTAPGPAEENLQARVRGTILMGLSNKHGHLVLTTGNKSEMATGYSTLYGDMAGGLAVLKDVPKTLVYELSRHRNRRAPAIPERVLVKPPSAELRPDQKDSDSLPPYEVLDPILEAYVERDESPSQIVAAGFDQATVLRVISLVDRAEYKRRQAPPGIKITPRAFGRDRRLPITNRYRQHAGNDHS